MNLLSFGEILWDVFGEEKCLGGAPLNFAAYIALLGGKSEIISAVGDDELGRAAIEEVEKFGVGAEFVSLLTEKETGKCIVTLNENAIPSYNLLEDVAYDYIQTPTLSGNADVIGFGTLALRRENNRAVLKKILEEHKFSEVFSDLNIRKPFYSKESIVFCLENASIIKISDEELPVITQAVFEENLSEEDAALKICGKFDQIKLIIITKGKDGSLCYNREENKFYYCKAKPTEVVSTVGAGDSFGAAFLTKYFENKDCSKSLKFASEISSFVCSKQEAISEDVKKIL